VKKRSPGTNKIKIGSEIKIKKNLVPGKKVPDFLDSVWLSQTKCFTSQGEVFFHKNLTKKK
jgi:hypothetical protein